MLMTSIDHQAHSCPVCDSQLLSTGKRYQLKELFALWKPIEFPQEIIEAHLRISQSTELYRCPGCELEIFLPQVIGLPSFYAAAAVSGGTGAEGGYYEDSKWDFSEALDDVPEQGRMVEFGCGPGKFLKIASIRAKEVIGVEFNPLAAAIAKKHGLTVHETANFPGSGKGRYDAAFSFHVLEHVADPMAFLATLASQVKRGGIIGISVPNQDGPIRYIDPCVMNMPPHHATRWRLHTFEVAAQRLGWKIDRVAYEPLLLDNHSYYSVYWPKYLLPDDGNAKRILRNILTLCLRAGFKLLRWSGMRYFPLLRGQSIYVAMTLKAAA